MKDRFLAYNTHRYGAPNYWDVDANLKALQDQVYVYDHPLIKSLPTELPGIYTIGGGRQIGKTTLLKQWIASLLSTNVPPESIVFFTGELIPDYIALIDLIEDFVSKHRGNRMLYLIIDEITYVENWDKGIKFCADAGYFQNCITILTGSDLTLMQAARMTFPGRRGKADEVDFHIYPLSFQAFLTLKQTIPDLETLLENKTNPNRKTLQALYSEFSNYLIHGGYLTAINDMAQEERIKPATLKIYSDWVRGDMLKRGKQETYLKEILESIIRKYNTQLTWHAIAKDLSIDSHKTVADYCELLASMDALFIQSALIQHKLVAAPKKARKINFTDPFIYHAIKQWVCPETDVFSRITQDINAPQISASLVEAVVSNQFRRYYPTYYIKDDIEIDVAYVNHQKFWPIEVKWRNQLRPKELKALAKYQPADVKVFAKVFEPSNIDGIDILPLPLALLRAEREET